MTKESESKVIGLVFLVMAALFMLGAVLFLVMDRTVMDNIASAVLGCGFVLSLGVWAHLWMAARQLRATTLVELRIQQLLENWRGAPR